MGFFWDLVQQYQIGDQKQEAQTLEEVVATLQDRVTLLESVVVDLAKQLDEDAYSDLDESTDSSFDEPRNSDNISTNRV